MGALGDHEMGHKSESPSNRQKDMFQDTSQGSLGFPNPHGLSSHEYMALSYKNANRKCVEQKSVITDVSDVDSAAILNTL